MNTFREKDEKQEFVLGGETLITGVPFRKETITKPTNHVPNLQRFGVNTSDQTKPITQKISERRKGVIDTFSSSKKQ